MTHETPQFEIHNDRIILDRSREQSWNLLWLRDNCRCPECWYTETKQRQIDTMRLIKSPSLFTPRSFQADHQSIKIHWEDNHVSEFSIDWLKHYAQKSAFPKAKFHWQGRFFYDSLAQAAPSSARDLIGSEPLPQIPLKEIEQDEVAGLNKWLAYMQKYGFVIINGVEPQLQPMRKVIERIAPLYNSMFGDAWDISQIEASDEWSAEHRDTAYSNGPIGPHTDGCYSWSPPGIQFFQIATTAKVGGANYLVDGFEIAHLLKERDPQSYEVLSRIPISYHYDDDTLGNYMAATHCIFSHDENGELLRFHFNDSDRLPFVCSPDHIASLYKAYGEILQLLNDPTYHLTLQLRPDQLLATDNWRVLHAREGFSGHRRLMGAYIERDSYTRKIIQSDMSLPHLSSKRVCTK